MKLEEPFFLEIFRISQFFFFWQKHVTSSIISYVKKTYFIRAVKVIKSQNKTQSQPFLYTSGPFLGSFFCADPMLCGTDFYFSLKDLDVVIDRLNPGTGFDSVHTWYIKNSERSYRNLLCKYYNKLISHTYIPNSMLKRHICPPVKNSSGNKLIRKTTNL